MKITHNSGTGKTVITLSWTETRQFISLPSVQSSVAKDVQTLIEQTSFKNSPVAETVQPVSVRPFKIGDNVIVHKAAGDDFLCDEFMARVDKIRDDGYIVVEDQDSNFFTVEAFQLELDDEN